MSPRVLGTYINHPPPPDRVEDEGGMRRYLVTLERNGWQVVPGWLLEEAEGHIQELEDSSKRARALLRHFARDCGEASGRHDGAWGAAYSLFEQWALNVDGGLERPEDALERKIEASLKGSRVKPSERDRHE